MNGLPVSRVLKKTVMVFFNVACEKYDFRSAHPNQLHRQAHRHVHDFVGPSVARAQAVFQQPVSLNHALAIRRVVA